MSQSHSWAFTRRRFPISHALLVVLMLAFGHVAPPAAEARQDETSTPELFEKVDPYTKDKPELLDRAGYLSFGPFPFAQDVKTPDVEEALGGLRVLWVETAHFRLGSALKTYRRGTDNLEEKKLNEELTRLGKKLPRVRPNLRELDPWLRLHLYAQRLEDLYADFQARAGVKDEDFLKPPMREAGGPIPKGSGPFLGNDMKFTVLLLEKKTQLERFARRWIEANESSWYRTRLEGGAWFYGTAAQVLHESGADLDTALHSQVVTGVTFNLVDGFQGTTRMQPYWLRHGIGLALGRDVDPRWCMFVQRESNGPEDETWRWEPRLVSLVFNKFVPTWEEMIAWTDGSKLEARHHMAAWSRATWLYEIDKSAFQKLLRAYSVPIGASTDEGGRDQLRKELSRKGLQDAYQKTPEALDEAWRKWVNKKYPKK